MATETNRQRGTDYQAACGPDPPDVLLRSETGRFDDVGLEIVVIPTVDMEDRVDNSNIRRLVRAVKERLARKPYQVWLHPSKKGRKRRVPQETVDQLVATLRTLMEESDQEVAGRGAYVDFGKEHGKYKSIADYVLSARIVILKNSSSIVVHASSGMGLPQDGRWLLDAIRKKLPFAQTSGVDWLAIDGSCYIDAEQVASFRNRVDVGQFPFEQIWVVTDFDGVFQLK